MAVPPGPYTKPVLSGYSHHHCQAFITGCLNIIKLKSGTHFCWILRILSRQRERCCRCMAVPHLEMFSPYRRWPDNISKCRCYGVSAHRKSDKVIHQHTSNPVRTCDRIIIVSQSQPRTDIPVKLGPYFIPVLGSNLEIVYISAAALFSSATYISMDPFISV